MSVIADFQVSPLFPSIVGGTGTTAKYFPRALGASIGVQSVAPSSTNAAGQLSVPGNSILNGQLFEVLVGASFGNDSGDPSGTVKLELVANTGTLTTPSYTVLASTTAQVPSTQPVDAAFKVTLFGTSASGIVQGSYLALMNGAINNTTPKALDNNLSGIKFSNGVPFGLVVRATFGTSDATNTASLYQFQIAAA
jgi:hypothetical protein